jgi:hypothetical protein
MKWNFDGNKNVEHHYKSPGQYKIGPPQTPKLVEGQKPTTNTQSAAIAQIAAEMVEYSKNNIEPKHPSLVKFHQWVRQLRAL